MTCWIYSEKFLLSSSFLAIVPQQSKLIAQEHTEWRMFLTWSSVRMEGASLTSWVFYVDAVQVTSACLSRKKDQHVSAATLLHNEATRNSNLTRKRNMELKCLNKMSCSWKPNTFFKKSTGVKKSAVQLKQFRVIRHQQECVWGRRYTFVFGKCL